MNRIFFFLCVVIISPLRGIAQQSEIKFTSDKYWVYFTDKNNSVFSVNRPHEFLDDASVERRNRQNIPVRLSDLPVNQNYVDAIHALGADVVVQSRWLNAISVRADEEQLASISLLPFVKQIDRVRAYRHVDDEDVPITQNISLRQEFEEHPAIYGRATRQIEMIHIDFIHELGYKGEGMRIAVLDGGFSGVDTGVGFESFWEKSQIVEVRNFPDDNDSVFQFSSHGSNVLSIMGGDMMYTYTGSAPNAFYYLFRTEITASEYVIEEDFWLEAAEYADFVGADIINSSLGYTTFDDPLQNHTYEDMDGNTTVVTKAADMAAGVGILVCNSAGNSGNDPWHYIGAPADGDSVFTIGAVNDVEVPASFSSFGPTSDGRLKPNVVCQGEATAVLDQSGLVYTGSGTSYSSPLMAGACASFWQAFPEKTNMDIMDAVQKSADHYYNPNNKIGYGVPDFNVAYLLLKAEENPAANFDIFPNPTLGQTYVIVDENAATAGNGEDPFIRLFDLSGKLIAERLVSFGNTENHVQVITLDTSTLASGVYIVSVQNTSSTDSKLLVVN